MRVIILSNSPETISEYLSNAGHEVKECLSTDVAERLVEIHNPDAVLVFENVPEVSSVTLRHVIKTLVPRIRVILIANKMSSLVPYAAALGVRDYVFLPADCTQILHRLENPAKPEDAAKMLDGTEIQQHQQENPGSEKHLESLKKGTKKKNGLLERLYANISAMHQGGAFDEDRNEEPALVRGENKIGEEISESIHQTDIKQSRFKDKKSRVVFRALTALVRTAFEKAAFISRKSLELKINTFRPAKGAGKVKPFNFSRREASVRKDERRLPQEAATESRPVKQEAPSKDEKEKFPEMPDSGARIREKATESEGRNRVAGAQYQKLKVLLLGQKVSSLGPLLLEQGLEVAADPADAAAVVANVQGFGFAPEDKPLVVLGTGTIADFAVKKSRPDAKVVKDPESVVDALMEMLEKPKPVKNLKVFPGGRSDRGQSLVLHSALYIVCPSRPGQAGEVAARLAKDIENCALVCAAPESTGGLALGIPEGDLICSDWRIPGSDAPLKWGGVTVWPVDPFKFLNVRDASAHALIEQIKPKFSLVVVDCAGNLEIVSRAPKTDGVIVLHKEGDTADAATSYWLKNYAGSNVFVMSPSEVPDVLSVENGFIVAKRGASANMNG